MFPCQPVRRARCAGGGGPLVARRRNTWTLGSRLDGARWAGERSARSAQPTQIMSDRYDKHYLSCVIYDDQDRYPAGHGHPGGSLPQADRRGCFVAPGE